MKNILNEKKITRLTLIIFFLSAVIRILIAHHFSSSWLTIDSENYINQADKLLEGSYSLYFPNGYPALIALVTAIVEPASRNLFLIILNIILSTTSLILFWSILKKHIGNNTFSIIALMFFAFYPNQLNYVRFILTEVPALFFVMISFYLLDKKYFWASGLLLGFAIAIKTAILPVLILFTGYLFLNKFKKSWLIFLTFGLIPIFLMMFYGYLITGRITMGFSAAHNFYLAVNQTDLPNSNPMYAVWYYLSFAINHPMQFISDRLHSIWEFWGFLPSSNTGMREVILIRLLVGIRFPLLILAIYGFIKSKKDLLLIFSAIVILSFTVVHTILFSNPRFNFMVEPFLIYLAFMGIQALWRLEISK